MNCSMGHHRTVRQCLLGATHRKVTVATAYLPSIWILIEIECRNYRGGLSVLAQKKPKRMQKPAHHKKHEVVFIGV
jgi:hypothetical protein